MSFNAIFTLRALEILLQRSDDVTWLDPISGFVAPEWGVARFTSRAAVHFIDHDAIVSDSRIVICDIGGGHSLDRLPPVARRPALQRVYRAALASRTLPLRLPVDWAAYHFNNLVAFFACPEAIGSYRWISQLINHDQHSDIFFWRITDDDENVRLSEFRAPPSASESALAAWQAALAQAREVFSKLAEPPRYVPLDGTIDLRSATYGAVTGHQTYSSWVARLTEEQKKFFNHPSSMPVKLRGPAGSGKTLALELKALKEVYDAVDSGRAIRTVFITHSWAMAEQVDHALHLLDERGVVSQIEVFPLIEIAKSIRPFDIYGPKARLLGKDSLEGHRFLLDAIDRALWHLRNGDWLLYQSGSSHEFMARVDAERSSPEWNSLVWDLMHEFSSVLAASRILPGITAEKKYLSLTRADWMMSLATDQEKRFVLRVYSEHLSAMRAASLVSTDQLVNDLVNHLESFAWDYRRVTDGFDLMFVDEFHLFSDQERQVLNYLSRNSHEFPCVFMSLDPRQSPTEAYAESFPVSAVGSAGNRDSERSLGNVEAVDLTLVHRFSPQILEVIKFIHRSYPALQLGSDWLIDSHGLRSTAPAGTPAHLSQHGSPSEEVSAVISSAIANQGRGRGAGRTAVVLVDDGRLDEFRSSFQEAGEAVVELHSRDDIDKLRFSKRSIVLSGADYVAGLQFDDVLVAGFPTDLLTEHLSAPQMRRILSALYVAVSRASATVNIHIHTEIGDIARLLQRALEAGVLEREPVQHFGR